MTRADKSEPKECTGMCSGCAFREGGAAYKEPYNAIRAHIAALGRVPFFCHYNRAGVDITGKLAKAVSKQELAQAGVKVCGGWAARIRELQEMGHYAGMEKVLRKTADYGLILVETLADKGMPRSFKDEIVHPELKGVMDVLIKHFQKVRKAYARRERNRAKAQ